MIDFFAPRLVWLALLAAGPLALHLLSRIRLRKIPYSSLSFIRRTSGRRFSWLRLKEFVLLVLRSAMLLFLVLVSARPALRSMHVAMGREVAAVLIIDNSYSMQYSTRFERARRAALDYLSRLTNKSEVALLNVCSRLPQSTALSRDLRRIRTDIESLEVTNAPGDAFSSLEHARALLAASQLPHKEIVVFTDLQRNAWLGQDMVATQDTAAQVPRMRGRLLHPRDTPVLLSDCGSDNWSNCAVTRVTCSDPLLEPGRPVHITAQVRNFGKTDQVRRVTLRLREVADSTTVTIPAQTERTVSFRSPVVGTGLHWGLVELEPDSLAADDRRYFAFSIPQRISVLLLADTTEDVVYLARALAPAMPSDSGSILPPDTTGPFAVDVRATSTLAKTNLRKHSGPGLLNPDRLSEFDWLKVDEYLQSGGALFLVLTQPPKVETFTSRFATFHQPAPTKQTFPRHHDAFITLLAADSSHPILQPLIGTADLSAPRFYEHPKITLGNLSLVVDYSDGQSFLATSLSPRLAVVTSALRPDVTDLPLRPLFLPLMYRIFSYLGQAQQPFEARVGDTLTASIEQPGATRILTPEGESTLLPEHLSSSGVAHFPATEQAGLYALGKNYYCVNVDPREGDLTRISDQELARQKLQRLTSEMRGQDLTGLFVLIAALCLAIEMLLLLI
ncbi:MAG: BatA and WFA domain-containing protein [candidate division WOR-3 bacterium]